MTLQDLIKLLREYPERSALVSAVVVLDVAGERVSLNWPRTDVPEPEVAPVAEVEPEPEAEPKAKPARGHRAR